MVRRRHQAWDGKTVVVVADAADHHPDVARLPAGVWCTTRGKATAVRTGPPPPPTGRRGRPHKQGDRLGTLAPIAARATFTPTAVGCYGRTTTLHTATMACPWYGPWRDRPTLLVLARTPARSKPDDLALLTTGTAVTAAEVVEFYAARWPAETMLQHTRATVGTGQPRSRTARAVARTVPFQLTVHTLTVCWYATCGDPDGDTTAHRVASPWYAAKTGPSLADMATALRRVILAARITPATPTQPTPAEIQAVLAAWTQAA